MTQKRSKRLQVVLDLAERRKKDAERFLAEHLQRVEKDKQQLAQLEQYLTEYQRQYQAALQQGLGIGTLQNYQGFMQKIVSTINQHKKAMQVNLDQLAQVRAYWSQLSGRHKALDGLVEQAARDEQQAEDKALQKQLDERAQAVKTDWV